MSETETLKTKLFTLVDLLPFGSLQLLVEFAEFLVAKLSWAGQSSQTPEEAWTLKMVQESRAYRQANPESVISLDSPDAILADLADLDD